MGIVYSANDTRLNRPVALKMILDSGNGENSRKRFLREAQAAARVTHPNICRLSRDGTARRGVDVYALGAWADAPGRSAAGCAERPVGAGGAASVVDRASGSEAVERVSVDAGREAAGFRARQAGFASPLATGRRRPS